MVTTAGVAGGYGNAAVGGLYTVPVAKGVYCVPGLLNAIDATDIRLNVTVVVAPVPRSVIIKYGGNIEYPARTLSTKTFVIVPRLSVITLAINPVPRG